MDGNSFCEKGDEDLVWFADYVEFSQWSDGSKKFERRASDVRAG
jgi:hypothetical protein